MADSGAAGVLDSWALRLAQGRLDLAQGLLNVRLSRIGGQRVLVGTLSFRKVSKLGMNGGKKVPEFGIFGTLRNSMLRRENGFLGHGGTIEQPGVSAVSFGNGGDGVPFLEGWKYAAQGAPDKFVEGHRFLSKRIQFGGAGLNVSVVHQQNRKSGTRRHGGRIEVMGRPIMWAGALEEAFLDIGLAECEVREKPFGRIEIECEGFVESREGFRPMGRSGAVQGLPVPAPHSGIAGAERKGRRQNLCRQIIIAKCLEYSHIFQTDGKVIRFFGARGFIQGFSLAQRGACLKIVFLKGLGIGLECRVMQSGLRFLIGPPLGARLFESLSAGDADGEKRGGEDQQETAFSDQRISCIACRRGWNEPRSRAHKATP